ncbi:hypothetical protein GOQ27_07460 [Clostridium sp. D2Q-11]|uniref:Bacterial transcriptional activator domain-containing protein n=1 Tax=Anaeromonas frigoriresistens TaxID=2683708 RepID=A0A942Z6B2_9FIRM|nr:BTAD domain-containing putative transcriptional regulator [Anaeromonas frigoriresistens]MBS4538296.1 hypothetical protein [Anaeromonas frigoriresistens]
MAKLEIYLLGRVEVLWEGQSIIDQLSHKSIGILSYMAIKKDKSFSRNKIANIFWDSSDSNSSRYNLRYNIWSLRKIFKNNDEEVDLFIADKESIRFNDEFNIYVDAENFHHKIKNSKENTIKDLEYLKGLYKGEFLEGFYIKDSSEFNDWVFYEREKFQRNYIKILSKLVDHYKSIEEYQKAIDILENMININPLKEELYLQLIKIYIKLGDRDLALHHYKRCCTVLREELNIGPMEETKKIFNQIQKGEIPQEKKEKEIKIEIKVKKKKTNLNLHYTDENTLEQVLERINPDRDKKIIYTYTYPLGNIEYYWISEVVDRIIEDYPRNILKRLPKYYWQDLSLINSATEKYLEDILSSQEMMDNKIFKALEDLLSEISKDEPLVIILDYVDAIDKKSLEFIKYILYRERFKNMTLVLIGKDDEHENIEEIKKYFKVEG